MAEQTIKAQQEAWDANRKSQEKNQLKNKAKQRYEKIKWEEYDVDRVGIFEKVSAPGYIPKYTIRNLINYDKYDAINLLLRPLLSIVVVPIVLSLGSYLISGASL